MSRPTRPLRFSAARSCRASTRAAACSSPDRLSTASATLSFVWPFILAVLGPTCSHYTLALGRAATDDALFSGADGGGRPDVLRCKLSGLIPARRRVGRQDFARDEARRYRSGAADLATGVRGRSGRCAMRARTSAIAAGGGPARPIGTATADDAARAHEVSILMAAGVAVGLCHGGSPALNTSMMRMAEPQHPPEAVPHGQADAK
jgi:hypothetical protein